MPDPGATLDLAACLERVRARDQQAARDLVTHLYPMVIGIVRSYLSRHQSDEDVIQDVFIKVFTRLHQYRGEVPITHWVSRLAVTTCLDYLRARKRRPELRWSDLPEAEAALLDDVISDDSRRAPNDAVTARDLVFTLLARLNPGERLILQLLDLEQKPVAEISRLTGWNGNLIKVRAFRARRKLRSLFIELETGKRGPTARRLTFSRSHGDFARNAGAALGGRLPA